MSDAAPEGRTNPPAPAAPDPIADALTGEPLATAPAARHRDRDKPRRAGWIVTISLLAAALLGAGAVIALTLVRLEEALTQIEKQQDLLDEKETFNAAMRDLVATAGEFDGVRFESLLPEGRIQTLATRGWDHRFDASAVAADTRVVRQLTGELTQLLDSAKEQAAANASGTIYESVIDSLGGGYVTILVDDADTICSGGDVLGCVISDDPFTIHFDATDAVAPYMTDFIRTGVSYHEFAHVLQLANPDETRTAVDAFGGDVETMADCFALTYLDGWTLHHRVDINNFEYYEVDVGYGYTCDDTQKQVVRDWYESLPIATAPVTQ
ncbi:MAG: hypothetical protein ABI566_02720 [Pseudolysinimonas sp.]